MVTCPRLSSGRVRWISLESAAVRSPAAMPLSKAIKTKLRKSISNCTCGEAPGYKNFDQRPSAAGERRLPDAGNQSLNLVPILFVLRAKLLDHEGLFQARFVSPRDHHQRRRDQSGYLAKNDGRAEGGQHEARIDRMPHHGVWPAANDLVAFLHGDSSAPVAADGD